VWDLLLWLFVINTTLLITHEIDSAYWQEWELFKLPVKATGFLIIHLPLVFVILYGLVLVVQHSWAGLIFSLALGLVGLIAFGLHMFFIKKGHPEFKTWISLSILVATLVVSLVQVGVSLYCLITGLAA